MKSDSDFFEAEPGAESLPGTSYPMTNQPKLPHEMPYEATVSPKHFAAVILSVLLGILGIDRMYLGRVGLGIAKLIAWAATFYISFSLIDFDADDSFTITDLLWPNFIGITGVPTSVRELIALPVNIWIFVDIALIGLGKARDGSGNPLISYRANDTTLQMTRQGIRPYQAQISPKHHTAVILSVIPITSMLGVDRFYTGRRILGILKILTLGGLGIWALIDTILIANGRARDKEGKSLITPSYYPNKTIPQAPDTEAPVFEERHYATKPEAAT